MMCRKINVILLLFVGVFFIQSSVPAFAAMTDSKETKVGVELREVIVPGKDLPGEEKSPSINTQMPRSNSIEKKHRTLPKTGEIMDHGYFWIGILFVLFASTFYYSKITAREKNKCRSTQ